MTTDRPPPDDSAAGDSSWPDPAEPTQPVHQADRTQPIPPAEPTQPIGEPAVTQPPSQASGQQPSGSWASGPAGWPAPDPAQVWRPEGSDGGAQQSYSPGFPPPQQPYSPGFPPPQQPFPGTPQPFQGQHAGWQNLAQPGWAPPGRGQSHGWGEPPGPPGHWSTTPPPPLAGYPPQVTPPRRGRGWLIAVFTIAAVVLVSLGAAFAVPVLTDLPNRDPTAVPTSGVTPAPTPSSSSPTPEPKPTPTMPTDSRVLLRKNPIYQLKVPAKCSSQSIPASPAAFRKQVRSLVACQSSAWKKALSKTPVKFAKPKVKFYTSSTKTPCGKLGTTFPASYCSGDSTIYFSRASYLQGRYYRLSVAHFVIHEYAHHVQSLAGILGASRDLKESSAVTTRRIELQAHCVAHYGLTVSGVGLSSRDMQSIEYQWDYTNDSKGHGSTKAERYWGLRGLNAANLGACNTWSAKAARVK